MQSSKPASPMKPPPPRPGLKPEGSGKAAVVKAAEAAAFEARMKDLGTFLVQWATDEGEDNPENAVPARQYVENVMQDARAGMRYIERPYGGLPPDLPPHFGINLGAIGPLPDADDIPPPPPEEPELPPPNQQQVFDRLASRGGSANIPELHLPVTAEASAVPAVSVAIGPRAQQPQEFQFGRADVSLIWYGNPQAASTKYIASLPDGEIEFGFTKPNTRGTDTVDVSCRVLPQYAGQFADALANWLGVAPGPIPNLLEVLSARSMDRAASRVFNMGNLVQILHSANVPFSGGQPDYDWPPLPPELQARQAPGRAAPTRPQPPHQTSVLNAPQQPAVVPPQPARPVARLAPRRPDPTGAGQVRRPAAVVRTQPVTHTTPVLRQGFTFGHEQISWRGYEVVPSDSFIRINEKKGIDFGFVMKATKLTREDNSVVMTVEQKDVPKFCQVVAKWLGVPVPGQPIAILGLLSKHAEDFMKSDEVNLQSLVELLDREGVKFTGG
ncbi:MAG: hypothetical protein V4669_11945 [Pseudomonadota bacterium]